MDEPRKSQILDAFKIFGYQFDDAVLKARADLNAGRPLEDLIVGAGRYYSENMNAEELAFALSSLIMRAARLPVRAPRKKTAVPAKRPRPTQVVTSDAKFDE